MSLPGYDAWATGGRYRRELIAVRCDECDEWTPVTADTEYGATEWTPDECCRCGAPFTGDEDWHDDEPPDPEPDDRGEEYGRFHPWA